MVLDIPTLDLFCYHEQVTEIFAGSVTYAGGEIDMFSTEGEMVSLVDVNIISANETQQIQIYSERE